nr:Orn/Lys/Arg decarboxylase N-terminal domain-containing protein [Streptomyces sp. SBT349]
MRRIGQAVAGHGFEARWAATEADARAVLRTEAGLAAALVAWDLPGSTAVLREIGRRFTGLPVLLVMADGADEELDALPLWVAETVSGYVWPLEDTPAFIAGRIAAAARTYRETLLPWWRRRTATAPSSCSPWASPRASGARCWTP